MTRRVLWAEAGLWLTILLWSLNFLAIKIGVRDFPPAFFTAVRFVVAAPLLLLLARRQGSLRVPRRTLLPLALTGLLGISLYQVLFTTAIDLTDVASAAILLTLSPVVGAIWGYFTKGENLRPGNVLGIGLGVVGAVVVVLAGRAASHESAPSSVVGDLAAIAAAVAWAAYGVYSAPLVRRLRPLAVTAWQALFGTIVLLPVLPALWSRAHWGMPSLTVLYAALPVTVFGLTFWQGATARLGPSRVLVYLNAEPAIAAIAAYWLLHSSLTAGVLIGGALSLVGVYLARAGSSAEPGGSAEHEAAKDLLDV